LGAGEGKLRVTSNKGVRRLIKHMFMNGMDISFLDEIEQSGGAFLDDDKEMDCLYILKQNGVNSIRLRIWNAPQGIYCNLEKTLIMAKRIKESGMHFLLDFHYSDMWADPGKQIKPKAWENLDFDELKNAVFEYTQKVMNAMRAQGTLPDMVQIGNEITPGMLWDEGKVEGKLDTDTQWEKFTLLVKFGIEAAKSVHPDVSIMIHIDRGGDNSSSRKFYDRFKQFNVEFDTIGLSFYPWWHGTLDDLRNNLADLAIRYGKDIVVVETAYPWTLHSTEPLSFIVSDEKQLLPGYPASVEGQTQYLQDLIEIIEQTPNGKGKGLHYWEPCWIPSKKEWSVGHANNWSNLTLFDFKGRKLNSLEVFKPKEEN
jgi:arabinogalactan endo-1,4-beta-galactosidase